MGKPWLFIRRVLSSNMRRSRSPKERATISPKWYQSISELPLSKFIEAYVDSNLSALVIEGEPAADQLNEAWFNIRVQYADAIGDPHFKNYALNKSRVAELELTLEKARILLTELRINYCTNYHERLNKLFSYKFKLDPENDELYESELQRAEKRAGGWELELKLKVKAVEKIEKGMSVDKPVGREYFDSLILTIENHYRRELSEKVTTWKFCELLNRIKKEVENAKTVKRGR